MRKFTVIDNYCVVKWGISYPEAILFEWIYSLPSWAKKATIDNEVFYFASYQKACNDLPALTEKPDTMYRYYKKLENHGLILIKMIESNAYVSLTEKSKEWNNTQKQVSDKHPSNLGQTSEQSRTNIRHIDSNTIESKIIDTPNPKKTASGYARGFVLESNSQSGLPAKLILLNDEAVRTMERFEQYYYKEKLTGMSLTDLVFTEVFEVELQYQGRNYLVKSIIEGKNHEDFDFVEYDKTFAASKVMNNMGFECFEFYFSYINIRKSGVFKKYVNK